MNNFYSSRSLARDAAKVNGGKVIDNGTTAPTGKRWQVLTVATVEATTPAPVVTLTIETKGYLNRRAARVSYVHGEKGKPIPVTVKRSKTAALLAHNLSR